MSLESLFANMISMSVPATLTVIAVLLFRVCLKKTSKSFSYVIWAVVAFRLLCPISLESPLSLFGLSSLFWEGQTWEIEQPLLISRAEADTPTTTTNVPKNVNAVLFAASAIWLTGTVVMLGFTAVQWLRTRRRIKNAILVKGNLYECDTTSPFVFGLKPKIYIPFRTEQSDLQYILSHERCHIKRFDHIIKPAAFVMLSFHWFNPILWAAYFCFCKDMEMSCDERALAGLGYDAKQGYCLALLSVARKKRTPQVVLLAFGESDIRKRVKNVLNYRKLSKPLTGLTFAFCLLIFIVCATDPVSGRGSGGIIMETQPGQETIYSTLQSLDLPAGHEYSITINNIDSNVYYPLSSIGETEPLQRYIERIMNTGSKRGVFSQVHMYILGILDYGAEYNVVKTETNKDSITYYLAMKGDTHEKDKLQYLSGDFFSADNNDNNIY